MKQILYGDITPTALQPFTEVTWKYLQDSYTEIINEIVKGFYATRVLTAADVLAVNGCVDSGGGTSYNISAGMVYYPLTNECFMCAAYSHALIGGQVPVLTTANAFDAGDPIQFSDGTTHLVHWDKKMEWKMGVPGSGMCDFADLLRTKEEDWHYVGSGAPEPIFKNGWNNGSIRPLRFKKDIYGWVHIEGEIDSGTPNSVIFTLPAIGYAPSSEANYPIIFLNGAAYNPGRININSSGSDTDVIALLSASTRVIINVIYKAD